MEGVNFLSFGKKCFSVTFFHSDCIDEDVNFSQRSKVFLQYFVFRRWSLLLFCLSMYPVSALRPHYRASFVFFGLFWFALLLFSFFRCENCIRPNKVSFILLLFLLCLFGLFSFCFTCEDCITAFGPHKSVCFVLFSIWLCFAWILLFLSLFFILFVISPVKTVSLLSVLTSLLEDQELSSPRRILTRYSRTCQKR